jgi:hypothetical protein
MRKQYIFGLSLFLVLVSGTVHAREQGYAIDFLNGEGSTQGIRLAYRPFTHQVAEIPWLGKVDLYWEIGANFWEYGEQNSHQTNYAISLSPVISKKFATLWDQYPVKWEAGIGVSLVKDRKFAGKDIGSHYQFEDRLGVKVEFGQNKTSSLALRYMHYSNGGLGSKNPGMDFLNIAYAKSF